ncbi:MBL fold metallo-hydrolase [Flavobacterium zepuense]|uniref:MBL fold metallo-hydrolase n=1 Tax=Flavobacterium zepuense TaxID=2593302 RepID=A0A552V489_9FLAO|nr:MBL fold metallo-hydrolase [Flavobacterium zepuense]TRW25258.1 MBL fold metallo-hydrolase [Flavobacterium zepuense]
MKIIPLNEGIFTVTKDKIFTKITREEVEVANPELLKMSVCPFLIVLPDDVILLDAGLGCVNAGKHVIIQLIEEAGYRAQDVTKVLLSHLHKDHIDGLGYIDGDEFVCNFPNANIYLQQNELTYALGEIGSHSFNQDVLEKVAELPNLVFMTDNQGAIGNFIHYEVTGGHTPFHQVFWIKEGGVTTFYGADNLPQKSYLKFHIAYKSDFDGVTAKEQRQKWEQQAKDEHWTVLFYHDFSKNSVEF